MTVPYTFANRTGNIPLSQLDANFSNVSAFSSTAATVTNAAQPNITSVGTLSSLTVTGGIVGSSLLATGNLTAGNSAVTGRITGNSLSVSGNVTGGNLIGTLIGSISNAVFANTAATVTTNAQPNITSLGTLSSLTVSANISASGNVIAGNAISTGLVRGLTVLATGNLVGGNANVTNAVNTDTLVSTNVFTTSITVNNILSTGISATGNVTIDNTLDSPLKTKASGDTGTAGQICWDANYIYVCVAANTWKRASLVGY